MLSVAICDDLIAHSVQLREELEKLLPVNANICTFSSSGDILDACKQGAAFDLFFLDVELGAESGITLAKTMHQLFPFAEIIFITANIVNAVDVGEATHTYFLTKPILPEKLERALNRALERIGQQTDRRLSIALRGGGCGVVSSGRILYCERTKRTTAIVCSEQTLYTPDNLDMLEQMLPKILFSRPHNSFLVNLMHVVRLERTAVFLDGGMEISVSSQRKKEFRDALARYIAQY